MFPCSAVSIVSIRSYAVKIEAIAPGQIPDFFLAEAAIELGRAAKVIGAVRSKCREALIMLRPCKLMILSALFALQSSFAQEATPTACQVYRVAYFHPIGPAPTWTARLCEGLEAMQSSPEFAARHNPQSGECLSFVDHGEDHESRLQFCPRFQLIEATVRRGQAHVVDAQLHLRYLAGAAAPLSLEVRYSGDDGLAWRRSGGKCYSMLPLSSGGLIWREAEESVCQSAEDAAPELHAFVQRLNAAAGSTAPAASNETTGTTPPTTAPGSTTGAPPLPVLLQEFESKGFGDPPSPPQGAP